LEVREAARRQLDCVAILPTITVKQSCEDRVAAISLLRTAVQVGSVGGMVFVNVDELSKS
jgi:hypothetical protein